MPIRVAAAVGILTGKPGTRRSTPFTVSVL
jgi:hypothetical protein